MFDIPIYNSVDFAEKLVKCGEFQSANLGLLYDKYYFYKSIDRLTDDTFKKGEISRITGFNEMFPSDFKEVKLKEFFFRWIKYRNSLKSSSDELSKFIDRRKALLLAQDVDVFPLTSQWRFVSGLGMAHPTENGFVWDRNLGVPFLPGSSVKGMVRAWAEDWDDTDDKTIERIFGSDAKSDKQSTGSVIFYDAYPTEIPTLKLDIMNVHYKDYYEGKKDDTGTPIPPADYLSPTPIFFLTVAPGQKFSFAVGPSSVGKSYYSDKVDGDVKKAKELLIEAIKILGAGAKTAVGYGRFG